MEEMKKKNRETGLEIAVIGMSGRFPGAKNIDQFWDNLKNGVESIRFFSDEELVKTGVPPEKINHPDYVKASGWLQDKEMFDAYFFGYLPQEAELMDPQVRFFHECCYEALEDAGYDPNSYNGLIGVYAGASSSFNWEAWSILSGKSTEFGEFAANHLTRKDFLSLRVSYNLNLKGPSLTFYTACSTSLVAIHLACRGLLTGECMIALAGGVTINQRNNSGYMYAEGMIASPDGHVRAFDTKAKGTVIGNGIGIVVLKRLKFAAADRDFIYAVIKGSAINNDGIEKVGFTAPSVKGQAEVIRMAQHTSRVAPQSITYIETHGTGTVLGDHIEIEALKKAFETDQKGLCRIGSVKTNVGHLDSAAGVTGFIKTVLALKHRLIPPSLNCENPNKDFNLEASPFVVNTELSEWKNDSYPLRAGVSSLGIGGTNAHIILEEAPQIRHFPGTAFPKKSQLILLSAKTGTALDRRTENIVDFLKKKPAVNLADVAYTLLVGRSSFSYRRMAVCADVNETIDAFSPHGKEKAGSRVVNEENSPVVFMFSGQGSQYVNMGLELYKKVPAFGKEIDSCFEVLESILGYGVKEVLYPLKNKHEAEAKINQVILSGPIKLIFEYSLAKLLIKWGIKPDAIIGHSFGEYTAACTAGVLSLKDALTLAVLRGRLMAKTPPGIMMSVPLAEEEIKPLLGEDISLAAVNSSSLCIVSGPVDAVSQLEEVLNQKGHECVRLNFPHASHSRMMESIIEEFEEGAGKVAFNKPEIPYISGLTGKWITDRQAMAPSYWARHMRETVRFSDGLQELAKDGDPIFIQVGPDRGPTLFASLYKAKQNNNRVFNIIKHKNENIADSDYLLDKIGQLWLLGLKIDWQAFYGDEKRYRIPLPTYPFESIPFAIGGNTLQHEVLNRLDKQELKKKPDIADWFYIPTWKRLPLPPDQKGNTMDPTSFLLLVNDSRLHVQLAKELKQYGHDVVVVKAGSTYSENSGGEYIINFERAGDYSRLFDQLASFGEIPRKIIHMLNLTGKNGEIKEDGLTGRDLESGFYSLLHLAKSVGEQSINYDMQIILLTDNMQDVTGEEDLCPQKAMVLGPVKVIPQQYPHIRCRSIDIVPPSPGSPQEEKLLKKLLAELFTNTSDLETALRRNHRWVRLIEPVRLEEGLEGVPVFRKQGVYLVTGGLGGIGLTVALHLARNYSARLILTGRSAIPPRDDWEKWLAAHGDENPVSRKIKRVMEIEEAGAEVLVIKAEAANLEEMRQVVTAAEDRFGELNGVIHAAGITKSRIIISQWDRAECEIQFQAKGYGIFVLEEVLGDRKLDFCLLMSSIASVLGGMGYVAYTAANIFSDAFVQKHNRGSTDSNGSTSRWLSVNWDFWEVEEGVKTRELGMTPREAVRALHRVLAWPEAHQVIHSIGDLGLRLDRWINLKHLEEPQTENREEAVLKRNPDIADWFYIPTWKRFELPATRVTGKWLLFIWNTPLCHRLVHRLKEDKQDVVTVIAGSVFTRSKDLEYIINPGKPGDYVILFQELSEAGYVPDKILHLWGVNSEDGAGLNGEGFERIKDLGLYSLLNIAQAVGEAGMAVNIQLAVVTDGIQNVTGEEKLNPVKAAVLGPIKVIPLEYSNINCRGIDIDYTAAHNQDTDRVIGNLLMEFQTPFSPTLLIAYRGNHRLVQHYEPLKLAKPGKIPQRLKEKGVYLITGGLGGMGFTLAQHLAQTVKARVIICDISDFPAREKWGKMLSEDTIQGDTHRKIQKILELEREGAGFLIYKADVSNYQRMKEIVTKSEKKFGKINGVIHTAGLIDYEGVIQKRTREMTEKLLAAKINGTMVLERMLKGRPLDFLVLFSSIGNILYKVKFGQVGYNAGHEFLNIYAPDKQQKGIFAVTIDWGDWREVGMAVAWAKEKARRKGQTTVPENKLHISPAEGVEAFNRVLESDIPRVCITPQDLGKMIDYMNRLKDDNVRSYQSSTALHKRPPIGTEYEAPRDQLEQTIANVWQEFFGYDKVGIDDDFFELGGDSLKAMIIANKIHKELDVRVPLAEFFRSPTIRKYALYIRGDGQKDSFVAITPVEKREYYPLSSAQKRMFILNRLEKENLSYNIPKVVVLEGQLDRGKLENTFKKLIYRHESLRTSFRIIAEKPVQRIFDNVECDIRYYENYANNQKTPPEVGGIIDNFIRPFDLYRAPLLRVGLIKTGKIEHILMLDIHHIVTDGIANEIFVKEFMSLYKGESLPPLELQYKDYSRWQNSEKQKKTMKNQETFWLEEFADGVPLLNLPVDYTRPSVQSFEGSSFNFHLEREAILSLKQLAKGADATLFITLFAIFNIFLAKLSGCRDIVVGTVTSGRGHADLLQIMGLFLNMLAIRHYPENNKTFTKFLEEVKEKTLAVFENQDFQFEDLVRQIEVQRDISRNPVFDTMFLLQTINVQDIDIPGLTLRQYGNVEKIAQVDLKLLATESGENLYFRFEYATKLFKIETIKRYAGFFKAIVSSILEDPGRKISEIEILTKDEKRLILHNFNNTKAEYPQNITVHQLFEKQAEQTPDNIAAAEPGIHSISYKELNEKANRLAWKLKKKGVRTNYILGLMVLRSVEMLIGILAILKSGGAYLPLDSSYPEKRIKYMLEDSQTSFLLTCGELLRKCKDMSIDGEKIDICEADFHEGDKRNSEISAAPHDPVYLIYTSGSTGNPKGVIIEHKNVINFFEGITSRIEFKEGKTIVALTTISFDIFVLETLLPLTRGVKVLIANENLQNDPRLLLELIRKTEVNMLQLTPSRLKLLISCEKNLESLRSVNELMVGGEAFPEELFQQVKQKFKGKIFNMYGPAETTVWSTLQDLTGKGGITIGTPILNTQVYILDSHNHPQPVGLAGELFIGGEGAGRGYVNRPELAAEKFIDNPFITGERVYRTGDVAKWTSKGNLEFLGRIDYQEKIRGFRVEFGEIECQLLKHTEIKEAVVTARKDEHGDNYLCAYIVSTVELDVSGLRDYLSNYLPDYMIPGYFVRLNQIPLTSNGKINRKALPEPLIKTTGKYEPPRNEVEEKLAKIWSRMLKVDKIGINDDFFEMGGNSMSIIRFASEINKEFGVELPGIKIFRDAKIKEISKYIINKKIIEEEPYMLLNHSTAKRLFCFPPLLGYGFTYKDFANLFADWSIYGFNFLEEKNRVEKYVELIKGIQKSGPYVLFGWSSGGNLAFEVAKELERQGNFVSDIIFLDSDKRTKKLKENQNFQEAVEKDLERLGLEILKKRVLKKTGKFRRYYVNLINRGKVDANIHFIFAEDTPANKAGEGWEQSTNNAFFTYRGAGSHDEFLKRGRLLEKNVEIIKKILYSAGTKNLNQK